MKGAYLVWFEYYPNIPKVHRFTLGEKIDAMLIETIEAISAASFTARQEKLPYVRLAIRKIDTCKILLLVLWETKSLDTKKYAALSQKIEEIGRMLGGWSGQLVKQNSPEHRPRES
ncbi:MAG: four helix bundle protein [Patescibacteria group bacterium]